MRYLRDRKVVFLIVLVCLILASIAYQYSGNSPQTEPFSSSPTTAKPVTKSSSKDAANQRNPLYSPDPELGYTELNDAHQPRPDGTHRNPFAFYQPPPPKPSPQALQQKLAQQTAEAQKPKAVCGDHICQQGENYENCPTDCQPPVAPITLKYIGYMKEENGAVAFLTDGNEVFMGRVDDIIANKYRVIKITDDSIELGYLNVNQSRTIAFQGNNKS